MESNRTITAVIRRFDIWTPWLFRDAIAASLNAADAKLFAEIWDEAIADRHWQQADLAACAREASFTLQERFTFLEGDVADVVANAAAYQWR